MYPEKRKEGRSIFSRPPKGKFHVLVGDRSRNVTEVLDASSKGIRLRIDAQVNIGENVVIRYQTDGIDLKLNGTVIWNSESAAATEDNANPEGHIVGIRLTCPSLLQAFW